MSRKVLNAALSASLVCGPKNCSRPCACAAFSSASILPQNSCDSTETGVVRAQQAKSWELRALRLRGVARLKYGAATSAAMEKNHPRERHFYLLFMAVAPPFQGKGLGSAILEATLKRADELRLPAYLENSNPKNTRLYERAGFVARGNILPEGPPLIAMWREVNTAKRADPVLCWFLDAGNDDALGALSFSALAPAQRLERSDFVRCAGFRPPE
jgi:GNAT superfamily N-acetyltransferase